MQDEQRLAVTAGFDPLARHYRWLEAVLAGSKLQRCRTAFLGAIGKPRRVLLLGEGNGRFLTELLRTHPGTSFLCMDGSARMLEQTQSRLQANGVCSKQGEFVQADILQWSPPRGEFDLIASHFFLDCFRPDQLEQIVPAISAAAAPSADWLLADFREPDSGWKQWRARAILKSMYCFFRLATRLPAARLTPPDPYLLQTGFQLKSRRFSEWGLLHTDWWARHSS